MRIISGRPPAILQIAIFTFLTFLSGFVKLAEAVIKPELVANEFSVTLHWTAPGDDGNRGQASFYDIRYSTLPVGKDTAAWWASAVTCTGESRPSYAGRLDSFIVHGLDQSLVYYFAIRVADEVLNWSPISNIYSTKYFPCADVNGDGKIGLLDIAYLVAFLYRGGKPPTSMSMADINGDGAVNLLDNAYLVEYLYKGGPQPDCQNF